MLRKPFFSSVLAYSSAMITVAGLAFFCVVRASYSIYYGHFEISPDEVGYNFQNLLIKEASGVNVVLAVIMTVTVLRGGWLLNESNSNELAVQDAISKTVSQRDVLTNSIASSAVSDVASIRRNITRLAMSEAALEDKRAEAKSADRRVRKLGLRWLGVGLILFGFWAVAIIVQASLASTGQRTARWFDLLQVDAVPVISVTNMAGVSEVPARWLNNGDRDLLLLGENSGEIVLYSQAERHIILLPIVGVRIISE